MKQARAFGSDIVGGYFRMFVLFISSRYCISSTKELSKIAVNDMISHPGNELLEVSLEWIISKFLQNCSENSFQKLWIKIEADKNVPFVKAFLSHTTDIDFITKAVLSSTLVTEESKDRPEIVYSLIKRINELEITSNDSERDLKIVKLGFSVARKTSVELSTKIVLELIQFVSENMDNLKHIDVIFGQIAFRKGV